MNTPGSGEPLLVSDLGERGLIERIRRRLGPENPRLLVGIGDDAAVVKPERGALEVLTTDALVEGVHFDRRFTPLADVGYKALAVNVSDVAAMGGAATLALLSLMLPPSTTAADVDALLDGFLDLAGVLRLSLAGGNITRSPGPLVVDVTVIGYVRPRKILRRADGKAGEALYVTGSIGAAAAGLDFLVSTLEPRPSTLDPRTPTLDPRTPTLDPRTQTLDSRTPNLDPRTQTLGPRTPNLDPRTPTLEPRTQNLNPRTPNPEPRTPEMEECIARYCRPEPRARLGSILGRTGAASACMDLSDGLADAVTQIAAASGTGATIDADALPIHPGAKRWFASRGKDPVAASLAGGEDYELVFAVPRHAGGRLRSAISQGRGLPVTRIGQLTSGRDVVLRRGGREEPLPPGFVHF